MLESMYKVCRRMYKIWRFLLQWSWSALDPARRQTQSRIYRNINIYASTIRLLFGPSRTTSRFKIHQLDYRFYVTCGFFPYYRPIVAFTLREVEEWRIAGERSGRDQRRRDLDTSLKVEYHRNSRADNRPRTLSALRKDDEGRLTGVVAKRQRQIENYLILS